MRRSSFCRCPIGLLFAILLLADFTSTGGAAGLQEGRFVGAAGCKSSSCHGGAGETRSQYLTWVQQDFHPRAYAVLVSARSARMAEALHLPAAQTSARCTVCHSPFQSVSPSRLVSTTMIDEGVSCENCHGAAEPWLRGHTRKDWTYATRVGAGMRDLRSYYVRANTCVACHQNLAADLLNAGHPELTFELDGQSGAEPKHWRDDPRDGPRAWLVGQAIALREMSWALANSDSPDPRAVAAWSALRWLLEKTTAHQDQLPAIPETAGAPSRATFALVQDQADLLAREASACSSEAIRTLSTLEAVAAATGSDFTLAAPASPNLGFRRAIRLVLALDRLSRRPSDQAPNSEVQSALRSLFEDVHSQFDFQPAKFAADLATFRATLKPAP